MNPTASSRLDRSGVIVATMAFSNFTLPFMFSGVSVTLPTMGRELAMSGALLGLFETLYLGTAAALMLPAGRLVDAGEKRSFFVLGLTAFGLVTLGLGVTPNAAFALAFRVVQGIAAALVAATNMAILAESVPRARLGRAVGVNIGAVYTGLAAGPFLAGLLTTVAGWRWMYLVGGLLTLAAAGLASRVLKRTWRRPRLRVDWTGAAISAAGLALLIAGSAFARRGAAGWLMAGGGFVLLVLFVAVERRARFPLLAFEPLRENPLLPRALTVQLLTYAGAFGTTFLFALYLQEIRGWSAVAAGRLLMISPVLMAGLAPLAGRMSDRIRPQVIAAAGVALICAGTGLAWRVPDSSSLTVLVLSLVAHGIGFALFSSPNMTLIMGGIPRAYTGMASALAAQMRTLGMVCSMMLITAFLSLHLGAAGLEQEGAPTGLVATMHGAIAAIGLLALLALVIAWWDVPRRLTESLVRNRRPASRGEEKSPDNPTDDEPVFGSRGRAGD